MEWGFTSIDGSKFQANNSKDNNFTKNKLDDRIKWLNGHTDEYLRILNDMDEQEDLSRCLHAGKIPEVYKDVISSMEVREVRRKVSDDPEDDQVKTTGSYGTEAEMIARAKEGYFVREPERNLVYCPMGEILRQKCIKSNGNIRYSNKNACRHRPPIPSYSTVTLLARFLGLSTSSPFDTLV